GLVAVALLCAAVQYLCWKNPAAGPRAERIGWGERLRALRDVWAVAALFIIVMGGIYGGVFTATEGAGIGATGAFGFALARRVLDLRALLQVLEDSARTTAMLFVILVGALIFSNFLNYTSMPTDLKALVTHWKLSPITVMVAICAIYVVLGTAMEELSMILLTIPVFFPLVVGLGFDPVWFGIIIVVVVQIGLISPPVGMNMFVVKSMLPGITTQTIFRGVWPFVYAEVVLLAILVAFPWISLVLPRLLKL
ncbi:MAG: TRAP transporter large permease subunit, partial [Caldimonas sp.]